MTTTKHCPGCGRTKQAQYFHRDRHRPDGLYAVCKQCRRERNAAAARRWRAAHPDYQHAYDAENRETKRAADRVRYWADVDTSRAVQREKAARFRKRHRRRVNRQKRESYARHAVLERALARLRRAAGR